MGMDLCAVNPPENVNPSISYNWTGWKDLVGKLNRWGVNTAEFTFCNDGDIISAETCMEVADAIERHFDELSGYDQSWLGKDIQSWRICGGYRQN